MATFTKIENFAAISDYTKLLVTALKKVTVKPLPFVYYKTSVIAGKPHWLLLVDHDQKLLDALKAHKITARGTVILTADDELKFMPVNPGSLPGRAVAKDFKGLGITRKVFLGDDAAEDAAGDPVASTASVAPSGGAAPSTPSTPLATPVPKPAPVQAATPKSVPSLPTLPRPADLVKLAKDLVSAQLDPAGEAQRAKALEMAELLLGKGDVTNARIVLERLAAKRVEDEFDTTVPTLVLGAPGVAQAALPPSGAVASAQQRLAAEEAALKQEKTRGKLQNIKASTSQRKKTQEEEDAQEDAEEAQKWLDKKAQSLRDFLPSFGKDKDGKPKKGALEKSLARTKLRDETKNLDKATGGISGLGSADKWTSKGVGETLAKTDHGDDIAGAAGTVAASAAAAASSLADVIQEFRLAWKTTGSEQNVHLHKAGEAAGATAASLVNISKGSVSIASHSGATEAGATVPILGIVVAIPALVSQINELRSAIARLVKQKKIHSQLEKAVAAGDKSQATLYTLTTGFIARDSETIGKGLTKVTLEFTRIVGHGVTAGGITGPAGVALVGVATAGNAVLAAVGGMQDLVEAHQANDRRKKLQPTLHAARDWKALSKDTSEPTAVKLTEALEALETVEKGTPAHLAALEALCTAAKNFGSKAGKIPKAKEFVNQLLTQAEDEAKSWKEDDAGADPLAQQKGATLSPQEQQHRNARKLMAQDARVSAQTLLDQAQREPAPNGGPAMQVLATFGIKAEEVYGNEQGDDKIVLNRAMRQKILFKLGADDKTAETLSQTVSAGVDSLKSYVSPSKNAEVEKYRQAKNLLEHGGEKNKRGLRWRLQMDLTTADIEDSKATLLKQVELLVAANDIDMGLANQVRVLLAPRQKKAA